MNSITHLLTLANSGEYCQKKTYFYPFKNCFLRRHGVQDGYDKQVIQKQCWRCEGSGQYKSPCHRCRYQGPCGNCHWMQDDEDWDEYCARKDGHCPKCGGSGWYVNKTIWLERRKFGGKVFHIPVPAESLPILISDPVNTYPDYLKHAPVDGRKAWRAALILFALFEPQTLKMIIQKRVKSEINYAKEEIRYRINRFLYDYDSREIPF